jgi:ABC-type uncharacterized transport system YnjBCD substrate-binding protein
MSQEKAASDPAFSSATTEASSVRTPIALARSLNVVAPATGGTSMINTFATSNNQLQQHSTR